jgi:hypothetical protein
MQPPLTDAAAASGPAKLTELQPASPEVLSLPLQLTRTGWLYQPFASGFLAMLALKPVGGSASILMSFVVQETEPPPIRKAVQVRVVPVLGPSTRTAASQPTV